MIIEDHTLAKEVGGRVTPDCHLVKNSSLCNYHRVSETDLISDKCGEGEEGASSLAGHSPHSPLFSPASPALSPPCSNCCSNKIHPLTPDNTLDTNDSTDSSPDYLRGNQ